MERFELIVPCHFGLEAVMKKEIIEEVLSRISIMFETGEAIKEINALNKAIEQLAR